MSFDFPKDLEATYEPKKLLGFGGMGAVFLAEDRRLGRRVAIKVVRGSTNPELLKRFVQEGRALARFDHPNLIKVYEHGECGAGPYLAMEYVAGGTLEGRREVDAALDPMLQIADGLAALHRAGVVHRDLKPANVLVCRESGRAVLLDFGIAKDLDVTGVTRAGALVGTFGFLAPELLRGKDVAPPCDWYAWGVTLYQILEGDLPFDARELALAGRGDDLPPPRYRAVDDAHPVTHVIDACLAMDPEARPGSRAEIEAILADPPPAPRRPRRPARDATPGGGASTGTTRPLPGAAVAPGTPTAPLDSGPPPGWVDRLRGGPGAAAAFGLLVVGSALYAPAPESATPPPPPTKLESSSVEVTITVTKDASGVITGTWEAPGPVTTVVSSTTSRPPPAPAPVLVPVPDPPPGTRRDAAGDPLPAGARLRLGSVRFRARAPMDFLAYSGDGSRVLLRRDNLAAVAAATADGRPLGTFSLGPGHLLRRAVASRSGGVVAMSNQSRRVRVLDLDAGRELLDVEDHRAAVTALALRGDGKVLATGDKGRRVILYDLATGERLPAPPAFGGEILGLALSDDGVALAVRTPEAVHLWDTEDRRVRWETPLEGPGGGRPLAPVAVNPDGSRVVVSSRARVLFLAGASGEAVADVAVRGQVQAMALSRDGTQLATGETGGAVRVWDLAKGATTRMIPRAEQTYVYALAFSPDGTELAVGGHEQVARFWRLADRRVQRATPGHPRAIVAAAFSPDGTRVATAGKDGRLLVWDASSGKILARQEIPRLNNAAGVWFSREGRGVLAAVHGIRGWPRKATSTPEARALADRKPTVAAAGSGGRWLLVGETTQGPGGVRNLLLLVDREAGEVTREVESGVGPNPELALSQDAAYAVAASTRGAAEAWDLREGIRLELPEPVRKARRAVFLPGGSRVALATPDARLWIADLEAGTAAELGEPGRVPAWALAASPDGATLAVGLQGAGIRLVDVASGKVTGTLPWRATMPAVLRFTPDGTGLLAAGNLPTAMVWDVPDTTR